MLHFQGSPIRERNESGLAHIPEDRQKRGLVLDYSLEENFILQSIAPPRRGFLQPEAIRQHADALIAAFDVRSGEGAVPRRASVRRRADHRMRVRPGVRDLLIAVQPRGLDVGSIEYIHKRLIEGA